MSYNIGDGTPVSTWNPFVSKCMRFVCMCVGLSVYMQRPEVPSALLLLGRVSYWTRSWADHWAPTIFLSLFSSGRLYMSKITGNLFHRRWGLYAHLRFSQSCFWLLSHHSSTPSLQHHHLPHWGFVFVFETVPHNVSLLAMMARMVWNSVVSYIL